MLSDVRNLEQRVVARLRELKPLMEEYAELQQVAERFGFDVDADDGRARRRVSASRAGTKRVAAKPARPHGRAKASGRRRAGGTRATGSERRARVLQLIQEHPGITVPDISKELGVDAPPLYRVVRKLQAEGVVKKEGKSLRMA